MLNYDFTTPPRKSSNVLGQLTHTVQQLEKNKKILLDENQHYTREIERLQSEKSELQKRFQEKEQSANQVRTNCVNFPHKVLSWRF